jgi:hypothetical protein
MEMARMALGGPKDEGRAPYQVALTVCEQCRRTWQQGRGEQVEVEAEVAERAACDAQHVNTHVGNGEATKASQTIPPSVRRLVVRRDGGRCRVPGCRHTGWLEVHHVRLRSEGGLHDPDILILLCGAHHRLLHRGFLIIEGTVSSGLVFRHADGTPCGDAVSPADLEMNADAFAALRSLGFKEGETRQALATARTHVGSGATTEDLVRAALQHGIPVARTYVLKAREPHARYGAGPEYCQRTVPVRRRRTKPRPYQGPSEYEAPAVRDELVPSSCSPDPRTSAAREELHRSRRAKVQLVIRAGANPDPARAEGCRNPSGP